ncbi:MAG: ROK family protein, partial [Tannerellaceae bacterium]
MKTYSVIQSEESSKTISIKRKILQSYLTNGNSTIADICKEMELSVPTVTKLIGELQEEQLIKEFGKLDRNGGRRPSVYGLNPEAGYFVGVEIMNDHLNIGVVDFSGHYIKELGKTVSFTVENSSSNFEALCVIIGDFLEGLPQEYARVFNVGITISGRVNPEKGLSYTLYDFVEEPLAKVLSQRLGVKVLLDNDTRAMGYGEFHHGVVDKEKNVIFLNFCWGFGISIIIDGVPYFGKSGFSGELGHMSYFDNEIICQCGKKGCVET